MPFKPLIVLLLFPLALCGQSADFRFYSTADGLSGNLTHGTVQDEQGFIWLLNDYKLHRFDGRNFILFQPPFESSASRELRDLDTFKESLITLSSSHLYLFQPKTGEWRTFSIPKNLKKKRTFFCADPLKDGNLAVTLISESGDTIDVNIFDGEGLRNRLHESIHISGPTDFLIQPDGQLIQYGNSLSFEQYSTDGGKKEVSFSGDTIDGDYFHSIAISPSEKLVALRITPAGIRVNKLDLETATSIDHPVNRFLDRSAMNILSTLPEADGSLWLCGPDRNLAFYDARRDTLYDYSPTLKKLLLNVNYIIYPYVDQTGTVWLMTQLGLIKISPHGTAFDQLLSKEFLACDGYCSFRGMTENSRGELYAAFYDGVVRIAPSGQKKTAFYTRPNYDIPLPSSLYADEHGLWLNNGSLLNPESGEIQEIPGSKDSPFEEGLFVRAKQGPLWWVYEHELFYLDTTKQQLSWKKVLDLPHKGAYKTEALTIGPVSGAVYVGHRGHLLRYEPVTATQSWFHLEDQPVSVSRILAIEELKDGQLWLATDIGLLRLELDNGRTTRYDTEDGLSNNYVCGMLAEGDSALWLSTNHGLCRFNIERESFLNFFEEDGLSYNEFNRKSYFKAKDGRMYFGGLRGINAFYPEQLLNSQRRQNEAARVVLNTLEFVDEGKDSTVRHHLFPSEPTIDLFYWHRSFSFEYNLTDYQNPEEVTYSYRMEGYEENWSAPSKFNFTRFSSLPTGEYVFRVKARDSHGKWLPNQLAVSVIVHAPWWGSWWAYLAYAGVLTAILYYFWRNALRQEQLRTNLMLEKVEAEKFKELDTFKSRLYTNLTHEFRTPLTVILGMANQIEKAPQKHLNSGLDLIRSNGRNLLQLINQLLDLSKLESGALRLQLEQGDIVPYLRYIVESFQTYANGQNLSLRFHTTLESRVMDYDPEQLKQIITNLISNAIKFTPSGGEVKVSATTLNQQLQLTVADTGVGIEKDKLSFVFNRFYQVDDSTTRRGEGSGIGLAHTQELVKLMEGKIEVESEPGQGTSFTVSLPIKNQAEPSQQSSLTSHRDSFVAQAPLISLSATQAGMPTQTDHSSAASPEERPKLLIIEDNSDVVSYLKTCLSEQYEIDVAFNGLIGIEKAIEHIPDLIVSDVMMPEKNGYDVCDTLKNDDRTSHIPIILLTAKADAASKIAGLRRGADAYLAKPFDREELIVRLDQLVERQRRMVAYFSAKLPLAKVKEVDVQVEDAFIKKLNHHLEENYQDEDFGLPQLCQKIRMSRSQLYRKLKALVGISPSDFIRTFRLNKAKSLLESSEFNVSEVAWKVGYKDLAHFSKSYQDAFGVPPSATIK